MWGLTLDVRIWFWKLILALKGSTKTGWRSGIGWVCNVVGSIDLRFILVSNNHDNNINSFVIDEMRWILWICCFGHHGNRHSPATLFIVTVQVWCCTNVTDTGITLNQHGENIYCFLGRGKANGIYRLGNNTCDLRLYPHCYPTRRARDLENMTWKRCLFAWDMGKYSTRHYSFDECMMYIQ